jgi:hypothetical protein
LEKKVGKKSYTALAGLKGNNFGKKVEKKLFSLKKNDHFPPKNVQKDCNTGRR